MVKTRTAEGELMSTPVASRILECTYKGKREKVEVHLGWPREEDGHFICDYEISLAGQTKAYKIGGLDSMQALQLALCMLGSMLDALPEAENWTWNGEPKTGLPKSLREPIVGSGS